MVKDMKEKNDLMDKIKSAFCRIDRLDKLDVLATIIEMAEQDKEVSSNTVAAECMISTRHARYWLKRLERLSLLIGAKKRGVKGGLFVYQLSEKAKANSDRVRTIMVQRRVFLEKTRNLKGRLEDER